MPMQIAVMTNYIMIFTEHHYKLQGASFFRIDLHFKSEYVLATLRISSVIIKNQSISSFF